MDDEDKPRPRPVTLGADTYDMSVSDIDELIAALRTEVARLEGERTKKQGSLAAAEGFFKT